MSFLRALPALCLTAASLSATARPVASDMAAAAARGFALRGKTLGARIGLFAEKTAWHVSEDGHAFFSVKMFGGGTVFLAGDTSESPVVAFTSSSEDYSEIDRASPLWAFLSRTAMCRASVPLVAVAVDRSTEWESLVQS